MATEGLFANMADFGAESDDEYDEYDDDEYEFDDDTEIHPNMLAQLMAAMGGDEAAAEGMPAGFMEMMASMQGMAPDDDEPESDWSEDEEGGNGVEEDDY